MAKKKSDDAPEASAAAPKKMKKSDAMREAIKRGIDKPQAASEFIKSEFGLDVTPQVFSSFKSISKKKGDTPSAVRVRRASAAPAVVATPNGHAAATGGAVDLAKQLKSLVTRYGADEVSGMLAVLRD
jgi:hypothetical protein